MARKLYTVNQKRDIVSRAKVLISNGKSLRKTAADFKLSPVQLSRWIKDEDKLYRPDVKGSQTLVHPGTKSSIDAIRDELIGWIAEMNVLGLPVSRNQVIDKASSLDNNFCQKEKGAKYSLIWRFLESNQLAIESKIREVYRKREMMEQRKAEAEIGADPNSTTMDKATTANF